MIRKSKTLTLLLLVLFMTAPSQAASLAFSPAAPSAASSLIQVGIAAAVRGQVHVDRGSKVGNVMESGQQVYLGDIVRTDAKGHLQILLLDQTTFTVGPNSAITIDEFIYDPATHEGKISAEILEGTFRFITGKIAKKKPENMEVKIPHGSIGIRGTIVAGEVGGEKSTVLLLGPGENNNAGERIGRAIVRSEIDGQRQDQDKTNLNRSGYGCDVNQEGVSPPFQVSAEQLRHIIDSFKPAAAREDQPDNAANGKDNNANDPRQEPPQGNDTVTEKSGQQRVSGRERVAQRRVEGRLLQKLTQESKDSFQQGLEKSGGAVQDGVTRIQDAARIQSGVFHYHGSGKLFDISGTDTTKSYSIFFDIDFGARTVGGGNSRVLVPGTVLFGGSGDVLFPLAKRDFGNGGNGDGFLAGSYKGIVNHPSSNLACGTGPACMADVNLAVLNSGGNVATHLANNVRAYKSAEVHGADVSPRFDGPSPP